MTNMKFFEQPLEKLFSFNKTSSVKNNNSCQQSQQSFNNYQHHEGKSLRSLSSSCDTSMGTPVGNQRSRQAKKSNSLSKTSLFGSSLNLSYNNNCFSSQDSPLKLPLPIQTLLTELYSRGPSTIGIFRKSPNAKQCKELRQKLEVNSDVKIDDFPVTVVASVLKEWLRSLPDCLLMSKLYDQWIEVAKLIELSSTTSASSTTTTSIVQNANNNKSTTEQLHSRTQTTKEDTVDNCAVGLRNASLSEIENENVPQDSGKKKSCNNHLLVERMLQQPLDRAQSCSTVNCETPISSPLSCSSNINNTTNNNSNNEVKQRQRHFLKSTQSVHNLVDVNYNYSNNHRYANNVKTSSKSSSPNDELDCHKIVQKLINSLDESNYAMLKALICVLRHIANNCEFNKMSAQNLGVCVGQSLLNDDNANRKPVKRHKRSRSQTLLSLTLSWSGVTGSSSSNQANNYKTSAQQQIDVAQDVAKYVPVLVGYMIENADQLFGSEISQVFAKQLSCGNQNKNSTQNNLEMHEKAQKRDTNLNFANHYDDGGQKASLLKAAATHNKQAKAAPVCLQTDLNSNLISLSPSLSQDVSHLACKQNVYARSPLFGKSLSLSSQSNSTTNLNSHTKQYQRRSSTATNNNSSSATSNSNHRLLLTANRRAPPVPASRLVTHSNDDNKYRTTITIVNQHLYPTASESTTSDSLARTNIATSAATTTSASPSIPTSKANSVSGHCSADSAHASDEVCSSTSSSSNRSRTRAPSSVLGAHSPTLSSSTQSQSSSQAEISVQTSSSSSSSSANSSSVSSSSSSSSDSPSSSSSFSSMSPTSAYSPTPPPSQTKSPPNIVSSTHQDTSELLSTTASSAATALVSSSSSSPLSLPSSSSPSTSTDSFERLNATGALSSLQSELDYSIDVQPHSDTCDNSISSSPSSQRLGLLTRLQTCAKQSPIQSKAISSIKQQPAVDTSNLIDSTTNINKNNKNNNHLYSNSMNVSNQNVQQYKKSPISRMEMLRRRQMMNRYSTILGVPDRVPNIPVCLSTSNYGGEAVIYNPQAQQQLNNNNDHHHLFSNNNSQIAAASFDTSVDFMQRRQLQRQFSYHQLMIENQQRQQHYYQQQQNQQLFNYAHHQFTNNTLGNPKNNNQRPISFSYKQTNSTTTNNNNNNNNNSTITQNTNNNINHQQYQQQQHHNNHRQPPVLYTLL